MYSYNKQMINHNYNYSVFENIKMTMIYFSAVRLELFTLPKPNSPLN